MSGYWEAPRKTPGETGAEGWASRAELDELRREVAALRREGHKGVSVASTEDWSGERGFLDDDARDLSPKTAKRLGPRASGLPVHARSRCRSSVLRRAVAIEAIRTVRRRARSGPRPIRSARRGSNRSWSAPFTRTRARDCPRRNPSTLATARTRALLLGKS